MQSAGQLDGNQVKHAQGKHHHQRRGRQDHCRLLQPHGQQAAGQPGGHPHQHITGRQPLHIGQRQPEALGAGQLAALPGHNRRDNRQHGVQAGGERHAQPGHKKRSQQCWQAKLVQRTATGGVCWAGAALLPPVDWPRAGRQLALFRGVANPGVGAALQLQQQGGLRWPGAVSGQGDADHAAIDFGFAKKRVMLALATGPGRGRQQPGGGTGQRQLAAVQIVAVGNAQLQPHRVPVQLCLHPESLLRGQQLVWVQRLGWPRQTA